MYKKELLEVHLKLQTKAGVTGLTQVYGKYNKEPYDNLQMDLMYIAANENVVQGLRIIFATVIILFMKDSNIQRRLNYANKSIYKCGFS